MPEALLVIAGYLLGSVGIAVWVARRQGIDIYQEGSGNPGASNVLRVLGRREAALVMAADLLKGVGAAALGELVGGSELVGFGAGAAAVVGHCYPIWHRFRGGRGMATTVGMMIWLIPWLGLAMALLWGGLLAATRVASIGSLTIVTLAIPATILWAEDALSGLVMAGVALLVIGRHAGNIARLLGGRERTV